MPTPEGYAPHRMSETGDPALIGRRIAGKFVVEKFLGGGAMGAVYRAKDQSLDRSIALKVMHPNVAVDPSFVKRFHREARAASRIDHPNAMRVIEFGEEPDGLLYIAMEYLQGRDLYKVIHEDWPLPEPRIADIMMKALSAMQIAHDMSVIHRDLKPENIMILDRKDDEDKDIVKVCDFGIAKITESDDECTPSRNTAGAKLSTAGLVVGTPEYMSPEQARGEKLDARSDLYSLGIILYQLLTGRTPFLADTALAVVLKHITDKPEPPSTIYAGVHKGLEEICMRALAKEKTERFQSARDMRAAIRASIEGRPLPADVNAATLVQLAPVTGPQEPAIPGPVTGPNMITGPNVAVGAPPASPAMVASKTTPLGTAVAPAAAPPAAPKSNAALFALVGLGALALGGGGVFLYKSRSTEPVAPVTVAPTRSTKPADPAPPSAKVISADVPTTTTAAPVESSKVVAVPAHLSVPAPHSNAVKPGAASASVAEPPPPAPEPAPAPPPPPAPEPAPAPAPPPPPVVVAFNPATCRAQLGPKRSANGASNANDLSLRGTDAAWTQCARTSIKDKPAADISTSVRLRFSDNKAFRGATCAGCPAPLQACIAAQTGRTVSVSFKSGDVTGDPEFEVPVTFSCN